MFLFKKRQEALRKKDVKFNQNLAMINKRIDKLDFDIAEFRRKYMTLQMHGRKAQSVVELEKKLEEMHQEAKSIQNDLDLLKAEHIDCVSLVEGLVEEFEKGLEDIPDE